MTPPNQFAATFLQEAAEQLARIEEIVLAIEASPNDTDGLHSLFRVFHTIKGSGAMFGFDEVSAFTHHVETLLDKVRSGALPVSKELVDIVLAAKDHITLLLKDETTPKEAGDRIIQKINALLAGPAPSPTDIPGTETPPADAQKTGTYRIRFRPEPAILAHGTNPAGLIDDLRALGCCTVTAITDQIAPLEQFTPEVCGFSWEITLTTDQGINAIKDVFIFVEDGSEISMEKLDVASENSDPVPADTTATAPAPEKPQQPAAPSPSQPDARSKAPDSRKNNGADTSVRVASDRLDRLVNLVGELVINQSRLSQIAGRLEITDLSSPTEDLERLVGELRDIVLGIRMMPIGTTFSRFKRLVRDLSAELGKEINLVTEGEDTELDKTVIDQLGDPLVHLIRNAIDHGLSTPEERIREGKPRRGTLRLSARHEGANVIVEIADDGRGLNREAIRSRAIEKGLIAPEKQLSESELFGLIFLPGFSTAKAVTNLSGRGVGMDVVKRQIDALRGSVEISSQPGQGTTIALTLPLTLAIIEGLLVQVQQERYIIPMALVRENVELSAAQRTAKNGRNVLAVRGELIPYLRLREVFGITGPEQDLERVVVVTVAGSRLGLVVDRVDGSRQTVIQSLGRLYRNEESFSGATIMGDGRVALILDVPGLVRFNECNADAVLKQQQPNNSGASQRANAV